MSQSLPRILLPKVPLLPWIVLFRNNSYRLFSINSESGSGQSICRVTLIFAVVEMAISSLGRPEI